MPVDLLDRALRAAAVPIALLDATGSDLPVVWVNAAYEKVTGYDADAARQRQGAFVEDSSLEPTDIRRIREALAAGREVSQTLTVRRADGSRLTCRAVLSPVLSGDEVTHWVVAMQDLTEQLTHDAEQAALVEAERRERRSLGLVAQVSDLIMDVDDPHALREIAAVLRRGVVGWAQFYLDDGGLRPADGIVAGQGLSGRGARHRNVLQPRGRDAVQLLLDGQSDHPVELALDGSYAAGSPSAWLVLHATEQLQALSDDDGAPARPNGQIAVFALPGRRRVLGVLAVHVGGGLRGLEPAALTVLDLTARRVGLVVDNARLYEREHRLAETLQRAMLPEQAEVDGLDVWTYYAPNSENAQVGGDWYDVLQVSPDVVGVVIGDVVGHDVEAAAAMGQLRSVVRSYMFDITTPGPVLERVDQLVAGMRVPRPAGLVLSTLTRCDGAWQVDYSRAGHLPALLVRDGAVTALDEAAGALIGFGGKPRTTGSAALRPGDVLLYYTDGLIERRDRGLREGLAALSSVASGITALDAAGVGEELLSRLADHPEDDVAVVVVRVPAPQDSLSRARSPRRRRWSLPSEAASIGRARHAVVRTCQAWGIPDAANAELVVSELVANAVLHGYGHVSLQLYDTGDGLRIEVEDANPTPPVTTDGHPGRVGGFGMQIVERLADWGWRQSRGGKLVWAKVRPASLPGTPPKT
ncbi:ATP-binding SpoIIE family protein phosphatase [Cellulomonas sp. URHE0023]|uniref:ATP-binding SpoIIE family protein phosphatase n=1 Tax=Cellulomonas sp. URHE0023 TaxID=1380354 RepID=UPI001E4DACD9|nr:ATP-binding SpoIIE family protein phosphatase [Cellulomonas sp. URHE0023]